MPPTGPPPSTAGGVVSLTCGQDVTVETFVGASTLLLQCQAFNGSDPLTMAVYKDGELLPSGPTSNFGTVLRSPPSDDDFGTYTFALSTEKCGTATAVSRILRQG